MKLDHLFYLILQLSLTTGLVIGLLLLIRHYVAKRYAARAMCWVWLLLAVRLIVPVQLSLPSPALEVEPAGNYVMYTDAAMTQLLSANGAAGADDAALTHWVSNDAAELAVESGAAARTVPVGQVLAWLWLAGGMVFLLWQLAAYESLIRRLHQGECALPGDAVYAVYEETRRALGTGRRVRLRSSAGADCPMLTGLLTPTLWIPAGALSAEDARYIFRHELTHWKQGDLWLKWLMLVARSMHWFNPLVHLMAQCASEDIELSCDNVVVRGLSGAEKRVYGEIILRAAGTRSGLACAALASRFAGDKKSMKKRLGNLFDQTVKRRGAALVALVLVAVLLVGGSVALRDDSTAAAADSYPYVDAAYGFSMRIPKEIWDGIESTGSVAEWLSGEAGRIDVIGFDYSALKAQEGAAQEPAGTDTGGLLFAIEIYPASVGDGLPTEKVYFGTRQYLAQDAQYAYYLLRAAPQGTQADWDRLVEAFSPDIDQMAASFSPPDPAQTAEAQKRQALSQLAAQWAAAYMGRNAEPWYEMLTPALAEQLYDQFAAQEKPEGVAFWHFGVSSPWIDGYTVLTPDAKNNQVSIVYQWRVSGQPQWRTLERLTFGEVDGAYKVTAVEGNEMVGFSQPLDSTVNSLEMFQTLYGNDLGLPDFAAEGVLDSEAAQPKLADPQTAAAYLLYLEGGSWEGEPEPYYAGEKLAGEILSYRFADGSLLRLTMVGSVPQDWTDENGANTRTPVDLARQWARGLLYKSGQYRYPILSETGQEDFVQARVEQNSDEEGNWGWKIGGSSPSARDYTVIPEGNTMRIVFSMWDSGPREYRMQDVLTFGTDANGRAVVTGTSQGYDYVPSLPEIDSLDLFLQLYDNELGLVAGADNEVMEIWQQQLAGHGPSLDDWFMLKDGRATGVAQYDGGVQYMEYSWPDDGRSVRIYFTTDEAYPDLWLPESLEVIKGRVQPMLTSIGGITFCGADGQPIEPVDGVYYLPATFTVRFDYRGGGGTMRLESGTNLDPETGRETNEIFYSQMAEVAVGGSEEIRTYTLTYTSKNWTDLEQNEEMGVSVENRYDLYLRGGGVEAGPFPASIALNDAGAS